MIHCNITRMPQFDGGVTTAAIIQSVASICGIAVPTFFIISGYLLAQKHSIFSLNDYALLIKRRLFTLVIPYLLWNLIAVGIRSLVKMLPFQDLTSGQYGWNGAAHFLYATFWEPEDLPLWFIRNLICFILVFPILLYIVKRLQIFSIVLFFLLDTWINVGIIYYVLGIAIGVAPQRFSLCPGFKSGLLLFCVYASLITTIPSSASPCFEVVYFMTNIIGFAGLIGIISNNDGDSVLHNQSLIFFIYAFHGIILPYVTKGLIILANPSGIAWVAISLLSFIITAILSIFSWFFCKKIIPHALNILTGNRSLPNASLL